LNRFGVVALSIALRSELMNVQDSVRCDWGGSHRRPHRQPHSAERGSTSDLPSPRSGFYDVFRHVNRGSPVEFMFEYMSQRANAPCPCARENYPMQDEHEPGDVAGAVSNAR
jgi:hypothetical protein